MRLAQTKSSEQSRYFNFPWSKRAYSIEVRPAPEVADLSNADDFREPCLATQDQADVYYYPLVEHPGISREFAEITTSEHALRFANKFGLLGLDYTRVFPRVNLAKAVDCESVSDWLFEASWLRQAFYVWDLIHRKRPRELATIVQWHSEGVNIEFSQDGLVFPVSNAVERPEWLNMWRRGETDGPARLFIASRFNDKMQEMASPTLLIAPRGEFKPASTPTSLLDAVWLEFSWIVTGQRDLQICAVCKQFMDVSDNRRHKKMHATCSQRMRTARYRKSLKVKA